jgi:hypothetical protein
MRFVLERRLMAVHQHLNQAVAGGFTITSTALALGFTHLNFSQVYRQSSANCLRRSVERRA